MAVRSAQGLSRRSLIGFDGGLNLRDAPGELQDNESPDMMNVTLDERGGVIKRLGYERENSGAILLAEPLTTSTSGNEITDAVRAANTAGDGWPYEPYTFFDARGEAGIASASSTEPWSGWEGFSVADQLFYITSSPTPRQGAQAVKYVVRPGDQYGSSTGERSEHLATPSVEGDKQEHWYAWSTYFPSDFVRPTNWCIFTQLHSDARFQQGAVKFQIGQDSGGANYIELVLTCGPFATSGDALSPSESDNVRFEHLAPLTLGLWHDFVVRIVFSATGNGIVQMWHRTQGQPVFTKVVDSSGLYTLPTIVGDPTPGSIYLKQGCYRNEEASLTTTIVHDGFARGNTFEEMMYTYSSATMGTVGIWPATTNLHPNGNATTNTTGWTARNGSTLTRVTTEHKFDSTALRCVTDSAQSASSAERNAALTNGTTYTWSAWVKGAIGVRCRIYVVDSTSTTLGQTAFTCNGGWQRKSVTFTATANNNHGMRIGQTATGAVRTYYIGGAQIEALPIGTPYVQTDGATATRNAARLQYDSTVFTSTQGYVAGEFRMGWNSALGPGGGTGTPTFFDWTVDANNYLRCWYDEATEEVRFARFASGVGTTSAAAVSFARNQRIVIAMCWTATEQALAINGEPLVYEVSTDIPTGMPANFDIGSSGSANQIAADKKWLSFGTKRLTDADSALFSLSAANPYPSDGNRPVNLFFSAALNQLIIQIGPKLFKRTATNSYTEITRAGPLDAFTSAKLVGIADLAGVLYCVHPDDGVLKYTGSGSISVVNSTVKGSALATWRNKLWATGLTNTVWWSNIGNGDTWTTAEDFIQIRDVNDDRCTALGFGQSLDSAVAESGLLVFKRYSTHRITDSVTGSYATLSAEAGASGPKAVAHLSGITMSVNDKGVWITDGENAPLSASAKLQPLFRRNQLNIAALFEGLACGVEKDRFKISLPHAGRADNDYTLEYHPQVGWFSAHDYGFGAYAELRADDAQTFVLTLDPNPSLALLSKGGKDDVLSNGTGGDLIADRFRTRWFEPINGTLTRLRRLRIQHKGAVQMYVRREFDLGAGELIVVTEDVSPSTSAIWGEFMWGSALWGVANTIAESYTDVYSLGTARAWQFEFREESDLVASSVAPLQIGASEEVGAVGIYELHLDFVNLSYA